MASWFSPSEPTVQSSLRQERIQARRNRIVRRTTTQSDVPTTTGESGVTKTLSITTTKPEDFIKPHLVLSQKQIDTSMQILDKLIRDGTQLTSNVERAVDARELEWRAKEKVVKAERTARLEAEEKIGAERFQEVEKAWETLFRHKVPHVLYKRIMEQKQACDALVEEKNKLIEDLRKELENKEEAFAQNIRKQTDDVKIIVERMNEHVSVMKKAYKEELEAMELAFMEERQEILKKHQTKWSTILDTMNGKENDYVTTRQKLIDECQEDLNRQWLDDMEEYCTLKNKMEHDIMKLELEYRTLKAKVLMNQEKLEYNYHTLKKRDEENTMMKNNQKRRLTKMNDTMANLRRKLVESEKKCYGETEKLSEDYQATVNQLLDLEKKYTHFQKVDIDKYRQLWRMNEDDMKRKARRLLALNRTIHEQYLAIPWARPDLSFMSNVGPWGRVAVNPSDYVSRDPQDADNVVAVASITSRNMSKTAILLTTAAKKLKRDETGSTKSIAQSTTDLSVDVAAPPTSASSIFSRSGRKRTTSSVPYFPASTLRRIMLLLCDESGFLIEDRVKRLITNLSKSEQNLVKINNIFNALGIYTEEEMHTLSQYFAKYAIISEDETKTKKTARVMSATVKSAKSSDTTEEGIAKTSKERVTQERSKSVQFSELKLSTGRKSSRKATMSRVVVHSHVTPDQLNPNDVLRALREFVTDHRKVSHVVEIAPTLNCQKLVRNVQTDEMYWHLYLDIVSPKHRRLWKALIPALEKFYKILVQRSKLQTDVVSLRTQNSELQSILDGYLRARINKELKLPPIPVRVLPAPTSNSRRSSEIDKEIHFPFITPKPFTDDKLPPIDINDRQFLNL